MGKTSTSGNVCGIHSEPSYPTVSGAPSPTPPAPDPCQLHAEVDKRYTAPGQAGYRYFELTPGAEPCTLADCGCRCREGCENGRLGKQFTFTHWSLSIWDDGTWMCWCFEGNPTVASKDQSHNWYSGDTKFALS